MTELHITVGMPGSGKSTIAVDLLANGFVDEIIYPDALREAIICDRKLPGDPYYNLSIETEVWFIVKQCVQDELRRESNVLIDATHLTQASRRQWLVLAKTFRAQPIAHFVNTDFNTCSARNMSRKRKVPQDVMYRFFEQSKSVSYSALEYEGWYVYEY